MTEKRKMPVDRRIGPPPLLLKLFGGIRGTRFELGAHFSLNLPAVFP
jgi:hypothetical protein